MAPKSKLTSFVPRLIFRASMAGVIPACAAGCSSVSPHRDASPDTPAGGAGGGDGGATGSGGATGTGGATGSGGATGAGGNRDGGAAGRGGTGGSRDAGREDVRIIVLAIFGFANPPAPDED